MLEKIDKIQELLDVPNADADTETAIANMKILNLLVNLRAEAEQLILSGVSKRFSKEQMIEASKYGYNYRDTTSFPNKNFDDNCKNNTRQWLTTLK